MNYPELLSVALTIGEKMLCSGAEVSRVEDSIVRICTAYGADRVDVFSITSSIVASAEFEGEVITQTRRITSYKTDFSLLDGLNALSRKICEKRPGISEAKELLDAVLSKKVGGYREYPLYVRLFAWSLTAGAFTVFFGGALSDGIFSLIIGAILMLCVGFIDKCGLNKVLTNIISSFLLTILAHSFVKLGLGNSTDKIIIGNIMLLIPGLALTNSLRDLISGDLMSGVLRFCEACLVALAIAGGYFLALLLPGGV